MSKSSGEAEVRRTCFKTKIDNHANVRRISFADNVGGVFLAANVGRFGRIAHGCRCLIVSFALIL